MYSKKALLLAVCTLSFVSQSFAARETAVAPTRNTNPTQAATTVGPTTVPKVPSPDSLAVPAYQSTSNSASALQGLGQVAGMGFSALYAQQGAAAAAAGEPALAAFMFLGSATSAAQALNMGSAGKQSAGARAGVTVGSATQYGSGTDSKQIEQYKRQVEGVLASARDQGYQIDIKNGTVTDPKGNTYSASDFSSRASMQRKGLSSATIAGIEKGRADISMKASALAKKELSKKNSEKSGGTDSDSYGDGGSGGGKGTGVSVGSYSGLMGVAGANANLAGGVSRDPAQVAGMTRDFHGTPIGVSAENLFLMMNRRYDLHSNNGTLLPNN